MAIPGLNEMQTTMLRNRSMKAVPKTKAGKAAKVEKSMHEFKEGDLHSGSKSGPTVSNPKQAIAIALSQSGQSKSHGFGHSGGQRQGHHRTSGHSGAHRIGKK